MSSQSNLPCVHTVHIDSHPSCCTIVVNLGDCPVQDMQPSPEQTFQLGPCLDDCPQVLPSCPPPAVPAAFCCPEHPSAWDPCPPPCATTCLCPAAMSCDSPQSKGGAEFPFPSRDSESCTLETAEDCVESFPLQHQISPLDAYTPEQETCLETFPLQYPTSALDPYTPETSGTCLDSIPLQHPILTADPSTFEVIKICSEEPCDAQEILISEPCPAQCSVTSLDPCTSQSGISGEPCMPQSALGTCTPQGTVELCTPQSTVELCTPQDTVELCTPQDTVELFTPQSTVELFTPQSTVELCTPEGTLELCTSQGTVELCAPQGAEGPVDTKPTKGRARNSSTHPFPRAPFRLNTCTSTILERCLSRCQKWLHGMK